MDKFRSCVEYARQHKGQVITAAALVLGLVSRLVPGFPSEEILSAVRALLGA